MGREKRRAAKQHNGRPFAERERERERRWEREREEGTRERGGKGRPPRSVRVAALLRRGRERRRRKCFTVSHSFSFFSLSPSVRQQRSAHCGRCSTRASLPFLPLRHFVQAMALFFSRLGRGFLKVLATVAVPVCFSQSLFLTRWLSVFVSCVRSSLSSSQAAVSAPSQR